MKKQDAMPMVTEKAVWIPSSKTVMESPPSPA